MLSGKQVTTHWGSLDALVSMDASIRVQRKYRTVMNGKLFTSAGVTAGMDMALAVVEVLHGYEVADEKAAYIEFRRDIC